MPATFLELRDRARQRADFVADPFIIENELKTWVVQSRRELWDLLVATYEDQFLAPAHQFSLSGSTSTYSIAALSPPVYKVRGVDRQFGGKWERVERFQWSDRNREDRRFYRLMGLTLHLVPEGDAAGTYRLWYVPRPTDLSGDGDQLDAAEDPWDEYIVIDAAIKCLVKDESDIRPLLAAKADLKARIEAMAANRDTAEPEQPPDIISVDWFRGGWPT